MNAKFKETLFCLVLILLFAAVAYVLSWMLYAKKPYTADFDLTKPPTSCQYRGCTSPSSGSFPVVAETGELENKYQGVKRTILVHVENRSYALCSKHAQCVNTQQWPQHGFPLLASIGWWVGWSLVGTFALIGILGVFLSMFKKSPEN